MRRMLIGLMSLGVWWSTSPCHAQRTTPADKPIHVKLEVEQPTSLAFPEVLDSIQWMKFTCAKGEEAKAECQKISIEQRGPYAYLTLLDEAYTGRMFVLGVSGKQYTVFFKHGSPADITVHVVTSQPATAIDKAVPLDVPAVLRALWTQKALPGQQEADVPPPAMPDLRLVLTESQAMSVGGYVGLMLRVKNTTPMALALDVRLDQTAFDATETVSLAPWVWPPRLTVKAIAAEQDVLNPGDETRLYVVLERRK